MDSAGTLAGGRDGEKTPHAVCMPFPAQGHVTPMMKLAKILHCKGFHITFVNTEYNHRRLLRVRGADATAGLPGFRFATIPDGLPPCDADATQDTAAICQSTMTTCLPHFNHLLAGLNRSPGVPPVTCVVTDAGLTFGVDAAKDLVVPCALLWTASACGSLGYRHYRLFIDKGLVPLKEQLTNGFLDTPVEWASGMSKHARIRDFPSFLRTTDRDDAMLNYVLHETDHMAAADAIIYNTFDELEQPALDALRAALAPAAAVYTVGPLNLLADNLVRSRTGPLDAVGSNLWREDDACLGWLDGRAARSVVYVNYGSIAVMSNQQLVEFAWGLANSGYDFLWVLRPDLVVDAAATALPPEFLEATRDRGLLASWCPQEAVLCHEAVGLFLTHNGWNSTLESLSGGVPMLSWPFFAEQPTNALYYKCPEWGVATEVGGDVRREAVERKIREAMAGEKGREMRKRAVEWSESAARATRVGGSSFGNLDVLIKDVLLSGRNHPVTRNLAASASPSPIHERQNPIVVSTSRDDMVAAAEKPHAVCLPFPAQGHVTPMMKLAKVLHCKGFHVTFVNTEYNHRRLIRSRGPGAVAGVPGFLFATIPDGLPPSDADATQDPASLCYSTMTTCLPHFTSLLRELNRGAPGVPPVTCVVADNVMSFGIDAAREVGVPCALFWTASACGYMGYRHFRFFLDNGLSPLKDEGQLTNGFLDTEVSRPPARGMSERMRLRDFPTFIWTTDRGDILLNFLMHEVERTDRADAVILNTFDELEQPALDAMRAILPPVYTIGPLGNLTDQVLATTTTDATTASAGAIRSSLWREDHACLDWLDGRDPNSVVFINYGSITTISNDELVEFAWGLAGCGYNFLWIVRPDLVKGDAAVLPPEFLDSVEGRGLLASWCEQEAVLRHPAVGVFLTHCGWNSTMESISAGVPMLCWPFFAEQQTNARHSCAEWGIGMEVGGCVRREAVEGTIKEAMGGEKGKEMRRRAAEWKEHGVRATQPSGRSLVNLDNLIKEVLLPMTPRSDRNPIHCHSVCQTHQKQSEMSAAAVATGGEKLPPHAVCLPFPAQGHITPMMRLAKVLHRRGFHVTFVSTEYNHRRLVRARGAAAVAGLASGFRFATIPDGLPASDADATQDPASLSHATMTNCLPHFKRLLADLNSRSPPVTCVVADGLMGFSLDAAAELAVPCALFWTASACGYMGYRNFRPLIDMGIIPLKEEAQLTNGYMDMAVDWAPGMSKHMRLKDFPSFLRTTDRDDVLMTFQLHQVERAEEADAVILNTFDELEQPALDAMRGIIPAIYTIGPLGFLTEDQQQQEAAPDLDAISSSLWREDASCLGWLDGRNPRSVVYVNFGSVTVMSSRELEEFAWGLAGSGHDFLWVVRPDVVKNKNAAATTTQLPAGFMEATEGRGMTASWCDQEAVLRHPAVGVFLTHSGWNSTVEALCSGVPMLCWPFFAEQQTNCRYKCVEWGVAMEVGDDVRREAVEGRIREAMGGEKGKEMRRRAAEWKEAADRSRGRSRVKLERLIGDVLLSGKGEGKMIDHQIEAVV
uniref:Glycosyltransferase N-terminal domain-containing protein n=1 Tax=Leersia perrieri TaxID=77586 RepID=A0A0D9VHH5_9ORYZ